MFKGALIHLTWSLGDDEPMSVLFPQRLLNRVQLVYCCKQLRFGLGLSKLGTGLRAGPGGDAAPTVNLIPSSVTCLYLIFCLVHGFCAQISCGYCIFKLIWNEILIFWGSFGYTASVWNLGRSGCFWCSWSRASYKVWMTSSAKMDPSCYRNRTKIITWWD